MSDFIATNGVKARLFLKVTHKHGPYNYKDLRPGQYVCYDFVDRNGNLARAKTQFYRPQLNDVLDLQVNHCATIIGTIRHVIVGTENVTDIIDARLEKNFGRKVK